MSSELIQRILQELDQLRADDVRDSSGTVPRTILYLKHLLDRGGRDVDRVDLLFLLRDEYARYEMIQEEETALREMISEVPDEPLPRISLASFLLNQRNDLEVSREAIEAALEVAKRSGNFVRHALNTKARIARASENYPLLEETVSALIAYRPPRGSQDVNFENDFMSALPPGTISSDVAQEYDRLCRET